MKAFFKPSTAHAVVTAPPSKSVSHRALIAAALSRNSTVEGLGESEDILATTDALMSLDGLDGSDEMRICNCRESGSTIRFLIPLALLSDKETTFIGTERLISRGFEPYEKICQSQGLLFKKETSPSCTDLACNNGAAHKTVCNEGRIIVRGPLKAGDFTIRADISSQFISGLFFALPQLDGDSNIHLEGKLESAGYIDLTIGVLDKFGIVIKKTEDGYFIPGNQKYKDARIQIEGDWSNAAFLMALGLDVQGLNYDSKQPDAIYPELVKNIGKETIDVSNCPDLAPILFAKAALNGGGKFTGTRRLKIKESDRASAMGEELEKFGVTCEVSDNDVTIIGTALSPVQELSGHNDHRIVMALSVMCASLGGTINGIEAVRKSYPNFFEIIKNAGVNVETYDA